MLADHARSSILVAADPASVMAVIADFPAYPEWAGYIQEASVLERGPDGRAMSVRFALDAGVIKDEYVLAYEWAGDGEVSWRLVQGKALRAMDGRYVLTAAPNGTIVDYTLSVDVNLPMIGTFRRKAEKVIMDTALRGLKRRVEQATRTGRDA